MLNNDNIIASIRSKYDTLTNVEQTIADFFLGNPTEQELSFNDIAERLFISKASLTRFAKLFGFEGFREFLYQYRKDRTAAVISNSLSSETISVFEDYSFIINEVFRNVQESTLQQAVQLIQNSKRIFVFGDGHSGFAANEFMARFRRLGFLVEAYTTDFLMYINTPNMHADTLVIGITLSGHSQNTIRNLRRAQRYGSKTMLITSNRAFESTDHFDLFLYTASLPYMYTGINISPQLPILIIIDLLFNSYIKIEPNKILAQYRDTIFP